MQKAWEMAKSGEVNKKMGTQHVENRRVEKFLYLECGLEKVKRHRSLGSLEDVGRKRSDRLAI